MCVCVCVYTHTHTHTHTRLINFLSSSTSARVETETAWWPVNSQCWEQHLTHNWSSINIYWTLINTCWTEGIYPCRAGMSHLLSLFLHFLTLFNELLSQLDCQFWWQLTAIDCPVTLQDGFVPHHDPATCRQVWKQKLQQTPIVNRVCTSSRVREHKQYWWKRM